MSKEGANHSLPLSGQHDDLLLVVHVGVLLLLEAVVCNASGLPILYCQPLMELDNTFWGGLATFLLTKPLHLCTIVVHGDGEEPLRTIKSYRLSLLDWACVPMLPLSLLGTLRLRRYISLALRLCLRLGCILEVDAPGNSFDKCLA